MTKKKYGYKTEWTVDEENKLRELAGTMPSREIAKRIGRTPQAIQIKAIRIGISLDGYAKEVFCMDCGKHFFVKWQVTESIRCTVCREKYATETKKEYDFHRRQRSFNDKAYSGNRFAALTKDGNKCRLCGATENLVIHHIDEQSYHNTDTPNNDLDNLTVLCNSCHLMYHQSKRCKLQKEKRRLNGN